MDKESGNMYAYIATAIVNKTSCIGGLYAAPTAAGRNKARAVIGQQTV